MAGLERFVEAQKHIYAIALAEVERGRKASHWMWFVFPQIAGLGLSPIAQYYAIASLDEARVYLAHPLLGQRLEECTRAVLGHGGTNPEAIFGGIDALKFRSSMTLFEAAAEGGGRFGDALEAFFDGARDEKTLCLLDREGG